MNLTKDYDFGQAIIRFNENHVKIGKPVLLGCRILLHIKLIIDTNYLQFKYRFKYGKLNLNKIYFINPEQIQFFLRNKRFFKWRNSTRILDGDWDLTKKPFEELISYQTTREIFEKGKRWDETKLYYYLPDKVSNGKEKWRFKNEKARDSWLAITEQLYKGIKKFGYKNQSELYSFKKRLVPKKWTPIIDEITVAIDRDGQFLFINGKHRLSVAKVLKIPEIPVVVLIRHKKWLEFRKKLLKFSKKSPQNKLEFDFNHPDLQDIPTNYDNSCFQIIIQNKVLSKGTVLDLSPNLGIFCHKFEDIGYRCYALEENHRTDYFLRKIKKVENKNFEIISNEDFINTATNILNFDLALKLNVPRNAEVNGNGFQNFLAVINSIKVKELIIGFSEPKFSEDSEKKQDYNQDKILDFLKEKSYFKKAEFIGRSDSNLMLFKLIS